MELRKTQIELRDAVATTEVARQHAVSDHAELRQVIECLPEAIVLLDEQNRLLLWNRNYEEMFPDTAPYIKPGISIESIYRLALEKERQFTKMDAAAEEAWIKRPAGPPRPGGLYCRTEFWRPALDPLRSAPDP